MAVFLQSLILEGNMLTELNVKNRLPVSLATVKTFAKYIATV